MKAETRDVMANKHSEIETRLWASPDELRAKPQPPGAFSRPAAWKALFLLLFALGCSHQAKPMPTIEERKTQAAEPAGAFKIGIGSKDPWVTYKSQACRFTCQFPSTPNEEHEDDGFSFMSIMILPQRVYRVEFQPNPKDIPLKDRFAYVEKTMKATNLTSNTTDLDGHDALEARYEYVMNGKTLKTWHLLCYNEGFYQVIATGYNTDNMEDEYVLFKKSFRFHEVKKKDEK